MTIATSSAARPAADRIAATPCLTPCSGADGVVRTLVVLRRPSCATATSVKVPPMSTAKRVRCISFLLSLGFSRPHVSNHPGSHAQRVARQIGERNILHLDKLDAALERTGAHRIGLGAPAWGTRITPDTPGKPSGTRNPPPPTTTSGSAPGSVFT